MLARARVIGLLLSALFWCVATASAQQAPEIGTGWSDFAVQGDFGSSVRFLDTHGNGEVFRSLLDLRKGLGLSDFDLFGRSCTGNNPWADQFSFTLSGIGNDPFPTGQLTVHKTGVYDLRVNFRQSYFTWGEDDMAAIAGGFHGLTPNHAYSTVRKVGHVNLAVHLTRRLRLRFLYDSSLRSGWDETTRSLDFYGAPGSWGFYARGNPFLMSAPLDESDQRVRAGIEDSYRSWNVRVMLGFDRYEEAINGVNLQSPELSINVDDPTTRNQPLSHASWVEAIQRSSPLLETSYSGDLFPELRWHGSYLIYHYTGPAALDMEFNGLASVLPSGANPRPYSVALSSRANLSSPEQIATQGLDWQMLPWVEFLADYRYSRIDTTAVAAETSLFDTTTPYSDTQTNEWRMGQQQLDLSLLLNPWPSVQIRPGVRLMKDDIEFLSQGVADQTLTHRIKTAWPILGLDYHPVSWLAIHGAVQTVTVGTPYTALNPHTDESTYWTVRVSPLDSLMFSDTINARNATLLENVGFHDRARGNAAQLTYEFSQRFSLFGGFSYRQNDLHANVVFIRGTPPLNQTAFDRTINRVLMAGIHAEPIKHLDLEFSGNYVRLTGLGGVTGEVPAYGPERYPYATGRVRYTVPGYGSFTVDLQRVYYIEELIPLNNFGANILTIKWSRAF